VCQVSVLWYVVQRCVWHSDIAEALVVDEMGLGTTFTCMAAAMICILLTEKVVVGLPLSILRGNTLNKWVNIAENSNPSSISTEREWYPL